jgi:hypothetical protein
MKQSNQEFNQLLGRLLGNRDFRDFEAERYELFKWLRESGRDEAEADWRIIGLALLYEAADRLSASVNQAEFEALLSDASAFLADKMRIFHELRVLAAMDAGDD